MTDKKDDVKNDYWTNIKKGKLLWIIIIKIIK
jgi:hypothetical protein